MASKKKCVVFDIDGTLANGTHRTRTIPSGHKAYHSYSSEKKEELWNKWHEKAIYDLLIYPTARMLHFWRAEGVKIIIATGRGEGSRKVTSQWLKEHGLDYDMLLMRPPHNYDSNAEIKLGQIGYIRAKHQILAMYEDEPATIEALRGAGVLVYGVG